MSNTTPIDEFDFMAEGDESSTLGTMFAKLNFGKCETESRFIQWENGTPIDITPQQFAKLDPKVRAQEVTISIDIKEFNPNLQFTYARKVNVGSFDWNKILKPSLLKALGVSPSEDKKEQAKQMANAMRKLSGAYVCIEDVPAHANKSERAGGLKMSEKYNTAKVIAIYPSRVECYEAWKSTYGKAASNGNGEVASALPRFEAGIPEGYTAEGYAEQKEDALALYTQKFNEVYAVAKGGEAKKKADARKAAIEYAIVEHFGDNGATPEQLVELIGV